MFLQGGDWFFLHVLGGGAIYMGWDEVKGRAGVKWWERGVRLVLHVTIFPSWNGNCYWKREFEKHPVGVIIINN